MQPLQKAFLSAAKTCNQRDCFESVYNNSRATVLTRGIRDPSPPLTLPVSEPSSQKSKTLVKTTLRFPSLDQPSNKAQTKQPKVHPGRPRFLSLLDYDIIPCVQGTPWYLWFSIFLVPNILASLPCPWGRHFWDRQDTAPLHPTWSSCHDLKHFGRCCTLETEYNENTMTLHHFSVNRSLTFRPFIV